VSGENSIVAVTWRVIGSTLTLGAQGNAALWLQHYHL